MHKFKLNERVVLTKNLSIYKALSSTHNLCLRLDGSYQASIFTVLELIEPVAANERLCLRIGNDAGQNGFTFEEYCKPAEIPNCEMCGKDMRTFDFWGTAYYRCECGFQ